ncbi:MAG: tandem-95 repeat protein [Cyanobacteriota bacterium]|nr:tandem-95 repeat protein [Cyanobacteriota bacterium]
MSQSSSTTDSGLSGTLVGADVDVESLVYGISGGTVSGSTVSKAGSFGTLTVNTTTGAYSYGKNSGAIEALSALQAGSDVFTFTVSDGDGALVTQAYSVSIAGANDSPTVSALIDVSGAVSEVVDGAPGENTSNRSDSGSFSIADVDLADLQSVSVTASGTTAPGGTVRGSLTAAVSDNTTGDGTGTVTWTYQVADNLLDNLAGGQSFTESFIISVADGKGGTVNQVVAVVVTGSNDAPDTSVSSASGLDNASWITVLLNGSDIDGTVTFFEIQSLPALGVLYANQADAVAGTNGLSSNSTVAATANSATLYFVPVIGSAGTTSFQYAAIDAQGAKDATSGTATISVALSNLAPNTSSVSANGLEDATSIALALSGADSDGTVTGFRLTSLPANGKLYADAALTTLLSSGGSVGASGSSATLYFVPNANWNGSTSVAYAAIDDDGAEDATPATATITVSAVNDPPNGTDGAISAAEDTAWITVVLAATDVDSSVSSYRITALPSASIGTLYRSASATATNAVALNEVRTAATNGTLTLSFKPAANASGSTSLSFVAIDASGLEDPTPATTTITVTEVNDAPVPANETLTAWLEDGGLRTISFTQLLANDNPGPNEASQTLTITSLGSVVGGTAVLADTDGNGSNDAVQFSPTANFAGAASVDYTLRDNGTTNGLSDPKTATGRASFTVTQVNDAPSFVKGADQVVLEDAGPVIVNGWATALNDGDSQVRQTLSFVIDSNSNPGLFSVAPSVSATGVLTYTPASNAFGSADITIRLTDNGGTANGGVSDSDPQTFSISVTPVNDAPVALDVASPSYLPDPHSDVWALSTSTIAKGLITAEWFIANDRPTPGAGGVIVPGMPSLVLKATDVDGTAVRFQFNALPAPATGILYFDNGSGSPDLSAPVLAGVPFAGTLLGGLWQTQLHFVPGNAWTGSIDLQYNATDAGGLSSTALASIGEPLLSVVAVRGLPAGLIANYDSQGRLTDITGDISVLTAVTQTYSLQYDLSDGKSLYQNISAYLTVFPAGAGANLISLNATSPETSNGNYDFTYMSCGAGNDTVNGSAVADLFYGGTYNDRLLGNSGNDTLVGEAGLDNLIGGDGDDWLQGGAGVDTITGGSGADRFYYEALAIGGTTEVITDFITGTDRLVFDAADLGLAVGSAPKVTYGLPTDTTRQFYFTQVGTTADLYLYWDSNGTASGGLAALTRMNGIFTGATSLKDTDFLLI